MGNSIGGRKKAKVMKINGETFKLKTPVRAWDVVKDYPGHELLDSEAVKYFGVRAKPLEPQQELKSKKIYFLVELPKFPDKKVHRRVQSGIHMSAKDRLECLMLSRRSVSDLSIVRPSSSSIVSDGSGRSTGPVRVKMRLPRAQVAKLVEESKDGTEVAEKIIHLYKENVSGDVQEAGWKPCLGSTKKSSKALEKRVAFIPVEGETHLDVASQKQQTWLKHRTQKPVAPGLIACPLFQSNNGYPMSKEKLW